MKILKITYWVTTAVVALMMTYSAYSYLTNPVMQQGFEHLGFPDYFRVELAIAKLIGIIVLLAPVSGRIKEWAYAGFVINFISAFIAHSAVGDPISNRIAPLIFLALLLVSYVTYHKKQSTLETPTYQEKHSLA
ncbi:DoxX family protein [Adhaeribacter arboris]|uniref:DoxX family protein n=1 Tax=Adhaeribacter arboris TaxID=2072846 RepID=A0A2T2YD93_9BACT|nr:DoxX family protein [Adhaeribacter arboris]PSR53485.1 DoxX family protein [Adhaeribacter arboris]